MATKKTRRTTTKEPYCTVQHADCRPYWSVMQPEDIVSITSYTENSDTEPRFFFSLQKAHVPVRAQTQKAKKVFKFKKKRKTIKSDLCCAATEWIRISYGSGSMERERNSDSVFVSKWDNDRGNGKWGSGFGNGPALVNGAERKNKWTDGRMGGWMNGQKYSSPGPGAALLSSAQLSLTRTPAT